MAYKVLISHAAERDIRSLVEYIRNASPQAATRFGKKIVSAIEGLSHFPRRGSRVREISVAGKEFRQIFVGRYRVLFEISGLLVLIHRVYHGARLLDPAVLAESECENGPPPK